MKFELTAKESKKVTAWKNNHNCSVVEEGAIGGVLTYSFTPTGLGTVTIVKCACNKELDLTEYDLW